MPFAILPPSPAISAYSPLANWPTTHTSVRLQADLFKQTESYKIAKLVSGPLTWLYLGAGVGLPFLGNHEPSMQRSLRAGDCTVSAVAVTEILKRVVGEKRPDSEERDSFPSGHATAAFAMATARAQIIPGHAYLWYIGATAISASRLIMHRHHWQDVVAGAAIGYLVARVELSQPRGLLAHPFILQPTRKISNFAPNLETKGWNLNLNCVGYDWRF